MLLLMHTTTLNIFSSFNWTTESPFKKLIVSHLVKKFPRSLCKPEISYCYYKSSPLVPFFSQKNPVHALPFDVSFISILSSHLRLVLSSGLFPSRFPTRILCAPLTSPIPAVSNFMLHKFSAVGVINPLITQMIEEEFWNVPKTCSFNLKAVACAKFVFDLCLMSVNHKHLELSFGILCG